MECSRISAFVIRGSIYVICTVPLFGVAIVADVTGFRPLGIWVRRASAWLSSLLRLDHYPTPYNRRGFYEEPRRRINWFKEILGYILLLPVTGVSMILLMLGTALRTNLLVRSGYRVAGLIVYLLELEVDRTQQK
uniref:ARAD1A05104p n=1 Tax=Blastobotrys adeninivorans TaxID=409370 RepID=A0A060SWI3_BLAAD